MNTIEAILIDSSNRTVSVVTLKYDQDGSSIDSKRKYLRCKYVQRAFRLGKDIAFVDEDGFSTMNKKTKFIMFNNIKQPIIGNCLIFGEDRDDEINVSIKIEEIKNIITFWSLGKIKEDGSFILKPN